MDTELDEYSLYDCNFNDNPCLWTDNKGGTASLLASATISCCVICGLEVLSVGSRLNMVSLGWLEFPPEGCLMKYLLSKVFLRSWCASNSNKILLFGLTGMRFGLVAGSVRAERSIGSLDFSPASGNLLSSRAFTNIGLMRISNMFEDLAAAYTCETGWTTCLTENARLSRTCKTSSGFSSEFQSCS